MADTRSPALIPCAAPAGQTRVPARLASPLARSRAVVDGALSRALSVLLGAAVLALLHVLLGVNLPTWAIPAAERARFQLPNVSIMVTLCGRSGAGLRKVP
jgi:hypothetical protein